MATLTGTAELQGALSPDPKGACRKPGAVGSDSTVLSSVAFVTRAPTVATLHAFAISGHWLYFEFLAADVDRALAHPVAVASPIGATLVRMADERIVAIRQEDGWRAP